MNIFWLYAGEFSGEFQFSPKLNVDRVFSISINIVENIWMHLSFTSNISMCPCTKSCHCNDKKISRLIFLCSGRYIFMEIISFCSRHMSHVSDQSMTNFSC